jgi:hypothetical protein
MPPDRDWLAAGIHFTRGTEDEALPATTKVDGGAGEAPPRLRAADLLPTLAVMRYLSPRGA